MMLKERSQNQNETILDERILRYSVLYTIATINNYRATQSVENERLTRDGTAEPTSREQSTRCEQGQGNSTIFVLLVDRPQAELAATPVRCPFS